jgi:hypothetical protein
MMAFSVYLFHHTLALLMLKMSFISRGENTMLVDDVHSHTKIKL